MKLKEASITILCNQDEVKIEIRDEMACTRFVNVKMKPEQFVAALSRLSNVPCEVEVVRLERVGTVHENKTFEFELPEGSRWRDQEKAIEMVEKVCPEGWVPDKLFNSQGSFFDRDGKRWARTTIRKWSKPSE